MMEDIKLILLSILSILLRYLHAILRADVGLCAPDGSVVTAEGAVIQSLVPGRGLGEVHALHVLLLTEGAEHQVSLLPLPQH